jgi:hypothetical protein
MRSDMSITNNILKALRDQQLAESRRRNVKIHLPVYRTGSIMKRLGFKK